MEIITSKEKRQRKGMGYQGWGISVFSVEAIVDNPKDYLSFGLPYTSPCGFMSRSEVSDLRMNIFHKFFHPRDAVTPMILIIAVILLPLSMCLLRCRWLIIPTDPTSHSLSLHLNQSLPQLMVSFNLFLIFLLPRDGLLWGWAIAALEDFCQGVVDSEELLFFLGELLELGFQEFDEGAATVAGRHFYYQNIIDWGKVVRRSGFFVGFGLGLGLIWFQGLAQEGKQVVAIEPTKVQFIIYSLLTYRSTMPNPSSITTILNLLLSTLIALSSCQSQCSPSFTLPNILKDLISLQYFDGSQQTYSYLFFSGMFSGPPSIAYSLSQSSLQQPSSTLQYYLKVQIQDMYIYFSYNSQGYKWTNVAVNFWITSRSDIVVVRNVMSRPAVGKVTSLSFGIGNALAGVDSQSTHVVFIVGLYCTFVQNLSISVGTGELSSTSASISLNVSSSVTVTNISLLSVIYNPKVGQFLSNNGVLNYKTLTNNQYFNLFNNFMPIYYVLTGVSSFAVNSPQSFSYFLQVINATVLEVSSGSGFDQLGISYLTIGAPTESVCSPCNNYVYSGTCIDTCPGQTYPLTFSSGGKACLTCDATVGQIMNSLKTGCNCLPGYTLISANQCINSSLTTTTCNGTNLIQNGSNCICSPGTYNISGTCGVCPSGQTYQSGSCIPSSTTITCQQGQYYDTTNNLCQCITMNTVINSQGACECMPGYYNINGFCITCDKGTVYNGFTCVVGNCTDGKVLVNGSCNCDGASVVVGTSCVRCGNGTYADKVTNLCEGCGEGCLGCAGKGNCTVCGNGYILDPFLLVCNVAKSKIVALRTGFPVYTMEALVTDFLINSTIPAKTASDLTKMVTMQFNETTTVPPRLFLTQNPSQPNQIRTIFHYSGLIPLIPFQVQFTFNDPGLSLLETTTVPYRYTSEKLQFKVA